MTAVLRHCWRLEPVPTFCLPIPLWASSMCLSVLLPLFLPPLIFPNWAVVKSCLPLLFSDFSLMAQSFLFPWWYWFVDESPPAHLHLFSPSSPLLFLWISENPARWDRRPLFTSQPFQFDFQIKRRFPRPLVQPPLVPVHAIPFPPSILSLSSTPTPFRTARSLMARSFLPTAAFTPFFISSRHKRIVVFPTFPTSLLR